MAIQTPDEAKQLFEKAMELLDEDIMILKAMADMGSTLPVKLAAQLLISPSAAYDRLTHLQEEGLVTNVEMTKREIFVSQDDLYFALTDDGQEMMAILPLVEKMRGVS